ncbi:hypothetical protein [Polaromonas glacialis]|uniref:hypothetical protein n=1 Tax=Polaromonas glacialis TaxID=866564 RepID=UPI0012EB855E|nr:hypothetical protein [Polaromonas glacialis]
MSKDENKISTVTKDDFAAKLTAFRKAVGAPERLLLNFACATHDHEYLVTMERFDAKEPFKFARTETVLPTPAGKGSAARMREVDVEAIDLQSWKCPGCAAVGGLVLCQTCDHFICNSSVQKIDGESRFQCRASCGASGRLLPLDKFKAMEGKAVPTGSSLALGLSAKTTAKAAPTPRLGGGIPLQITKKK